MRLKDLRVDLKVVVPQVCRCSRWPGARPFDCLGLSRQHARRRPALASPKPQGRECSCAGHTNRQIARDLFISESTAGVHVSHILRKLGVSNRVQAAAIAHQLQTTPQIHGVIRDQRDLSWRHARAVLVAEVMG